MGISLTKAQLATVLDCKFGSDAECTFRGVAFDSRDIQGGELFLALRGEESHGHQFLDMAMSRGAALALVEDEQLLNSSEHRERLVFVPDTLKAFWTLAAWWRDELNIPVLGITGSVGKTTIKEMVAAILLQHSVGSYSLKSYNNHTGLHYTICCASPQHNWLVLEMGMNSPGEMRELTKIARPDVVMISSIALAHVQDFDSIDEIADAKFEIIEGLQPGGTCILPAGEQVFESALERHPIPEGVQLRYFSESSNELSSCWYDDLSLRDFDGIDFNLHFGADTVPISLGILARHNARNAVSATLAAMSLLPELTLDEVSSGLAKFRAPSMRMNVKRSLRGPVIIDDCYNANPASMRAALSLAHEISQSGKKVGYILGDMLELGSDSVAYHKEIGEIVAAQNPEYVIAVGEFAEDLIGPVKEAGLKSFTAESAIAAAHTASKMSVDVILVKASRGVGLDQTVDTLLPLYGGELILPPEGNEAGFEKN